MRGLTAANQSEYNSYRCMKRRCYCKSEPSYKYCGAKGVKVCRRWLLSFAAFLEDMGRKPSPRHSIDRYPDNDGDYEPGNCRWATPEEQSRNRPGYNRMIDVNGVARCVGEWSKLTGISEYTLRSRLDLGWSDEQAVSVKPVMGANPLGRKRRGCQPPKIGAYYIGWHKTVQKWQVRFRTAEKWEYRGVYPTREAAEAAVTRMSACA